MDPYHTEKFREYLKRLLQSPEQAVEMGKSSLQKLERFLFDQVSKGFWDAFAYVEEKQNDG